MRFLAIFGLVALAEMATFFWVESRIGLGWALGLALLTAVTGSILVRRAGLSVLGRIQAKWSEGQLPGRELFDGAAILVAGAFLISPGFITDILGFLLLVPPVRALLYRLVSKRLTSRFTVFRAGSEVAQGRREDPDSSSTDVIDVDGWEQ